MGKYCVIRTDLMSGTKQPADLLSIRFDDGSGHAKEVENGTLVEIVELEKGEREVWKAKAATSATPLNKLAIVDGVEVNYDERKKNLDEYINEKGKIVRAYIPRDRNMFSVTAEGFVSSEPPEVKGKLGIGAGGKMETLTSGTAVGECVAIEKAGRYTYYVIKVDGTLTAE